MNFGIASPYIEAFGISKAAGSRIFQVIDNTPEINLAKGNGEKIDDLKGNIKLKNVHFHYPSRKEVPVSLRMMQSFRKYNFIISFIVFKF